MTARRAISLAIAGFAATALLGACAESAPQAGPTTAGSSAPTATTAPAASGAVDAPCALLSTAEVTTLLGAAPGEPKERGYGSGFAECIWEGTGKNMVRLSIVPVANLEKDFVKQLNTIGPVPALGVGATAFPGVAGIGFASGGGASVGFVAGEHGVVLAVRTGDGKDQKGDLAKATATATILKGRFA